MDADLQLLVNPDRARISENALASVHARRAPPEDPDPSFAGDDEDDDVDDDDDDDVEDEEEGSDMSVVEVAHKGTRRSAPQPQPRAASSRSEIVAEKTALLYKLDRLEKSGEHVPRRYTLNDDIYELRTEVSRIERDRNLRKSIKFQRSLLVSFSSGLEFLNNRFDPIGANLEGWSESVHDGIDQYDDVFAELFDKYQTSSTLPPELKLLIMLASGAFMHHLTQSMFKSYPGAEHVMKENPGLARQFASATAKSMAKEQTAAGNPLGGGLASMFSGMFGGGAQPAAPAADIEEIFSEISAEDSVVQEVTKARATASAPAGALVMDI